MVEALIGLVGGILGCMLVLLIGMVNASSKEQRSNYKDMTTKIEAIQERLTHMVLIETYTIEKNRIEIKLDDHNNRILQLEFRIKED